MPPTNAILSTGARNAATAAIGALFNGGKLRAYDGTQPLTPQTALAVSNHLLAEWSIPTPAFGAPATGVATANAMGIANILLSGKATFFRVVQSDGVTVVEDGNIGEGASITVGAGGAVQGATSVPVQALTFNVYAGTVLNFGNGKTATVTTDAAAGAVALVVSALPLALSAGDVAAFAMIMNSANLVQGNQQVMSSLTLSVPAAA